MTKRSVPSNARRARMSGASGLARLCGGVWTWPIGLQVVPSSAKSPIDVGACLKINAATRFLGDEPEGTAIAAAINSSPIGTGNFASWTAWQGHGATPPPLSAPRSAALAGHSKVWPAFVARTSLSFAQVAPTMGPKSLMPWRATVRVRPSPPSFKMAPKPRDVKTTAVCETPSVGEELEHARCCGSKKPGQVAGNTDSGVAMKPG
mmetsp:Transcript_67946/g.189788  ORF Transcript_67946/g.189788 Transcript_67946/m.189788 type:complete len:206 (+) Transcript_67946:301-918(+)